MSVIEHNKVKERVHLSDIGLYLKIVKMDFNPKTNAQLAELISEHFNVICLEEDVNSYERLYRMSEQEDYEKLSRMSTFNNIEQLIE